MCAIDEAEPSDIYFTEARKARKPYKCGECGRPVEIGETYHYAKMLYDGLWTTARTCAHCEVAQSWLITNCGGFMHHGVDEDIYDHTKEYPALAAGLLRLNIGMRRGWKRFDGAGLMAVPQEPRTIESTLIDPLSRWFAGPLVLVARATGDAS